MIRHTISYYVLAYILHFYIQHPHSHIHMHRYISQSCRNAHFNTVEAQEAAVYPPNFEGKIFVQVGYVSDYIVSDYSVCMCVCVYVCMCVYPPNFEGKIFVQVGVHTYIHIHTYTYTYTYTYIHYDISCRRRRSRRCRRPGRKTAV
jgi:hypothetical protein